ncbi:MAG TPA: hydrolase [Thermoanaerobaculia bacterium]|jgi:nicotinamidase-related amidase|nr:hydrolase [Thermoanaerobaculia bacterium]
MARLHRADAFLVVIDVQQKLMPVIDDREAVERNLDRLVRGSKIVDIPAILTEQYVQGLGPTVPVIRRAFEETSGYEPIEKSCFSAFGCPEFVMAMRNLHRKQVIIAGIEAHVCVYQTVGDLLANGYDVTIVADAISSRTPANKDVAIRRMLFDGARLSSTEMVLFELTVNSGTDEFREISRLVK